MNEMDNDYKMREGLILNDLNVASKIYIDLGYLKYLELGKLYLSPGMNGEVHNKIIERNSDPIFLKRYSDELKYAFHGIDIPSTDDIKINDIKTKDDLTVLLSPSFKDILPGIRDFIGEVRNNLLITKSSEQIEIFIGFQDVPNLSPHIKNKLLAEYAEFFDTRVSAVTEPLSKDSNYHAYFIVNLGSLTNVKIEELNDQKMFNTTIYCRKVLPLTKLEYLEQNKDEIPQTLVNIELLMIAASKFQFTDPPACDM